MKIIIRELGLEEGSNTLTTPGTKEKAEDLVIEDVPLEEDQVAWYRSLCMRASYLSQGRPDLGSAVTLAAEGWCS